MKQKPALIFFIALFAHLGLVGQDVKDELRHLQEANGQLQNCKLDLRYTELEGVQGRNILSQYDAYYLFQDPNNYQFVSDQTEFYSGNGLVITVSLEERLMVLSPMSEANEPMPGIKGIERLARSIEFIDSGDSKLGALRVQLTGEVYQADIVYERNGHLLKKLVLYASDGKRTQRLEIEYQKYEFLMEPVLSPDVFNQYLSSGAQGYKPIGKYSGFDFINLTFQP